MQNQIQINDEEEMVEVRAAEVDAMTAIALGISEQNALVLNSIKALSDTMIAQGENLVATFAALRDALAGLSIVVNVPQQPAPIVNMPEITLKPSDLKVTMPKAKKEVQKIKRNRDGLIESTETEIQY
jgi:hypothetical protein